MTLHQIGPTHSIKASHNNSTVDVEPKPLFYVDNTPNTEFTPPIYDIDTKANPNEIMSQVRNIRISGPVSFTNKENQARIEPIFTPDPQLSSTRLNNSIEENNSHILADHNVSMPMITISIDSSCETGASRKIIVDRTSSPRPSPPKSPKLTVVANKPSSPKSPKMTIIANQPSSSPKPPKLTITTTNTNANNNNNYSENKNKPVDLPRTRKRKADNNGANDPPPQKKNASDVIVLDDTILDVDQEDDDSVIFVSDSSDRSNKQKAANFISINSNKQQQSPRSTRAQRRLQKKLMKKEKRSPQQAKFQAQAKLPSPTVKRLQPAKCQPNTKLKSPQNPKKNLRSNAANIPLRGNNRFDTKSPHSSFNERSSNAAQMNQAANESGSNREAKKKLIIKHEMQEKLFKEKPELFEKRMIIIDGSNVARTHGLRTRSYSIKGIELCMKHFENLGFTVKAVVPQMRLKRSQSSDPEALEKLNNAGKIIMTPCKNLPGGRSTSYDDRFVLKAAELNNGAVISNDNFVDLLQEKEIWDEIIRERVVGFSWCDDFIMIPEDPYGKIGPSLDIILHKLKDDAEIDEKYIEATKTTTTATTAIPVITNTTTTAAAAGTTTATVTTPAATISILDDSEPSLIICDN